MKQPGKIITCSYIFPTCSEISEFPRPIEGIQSMRSRKDDTEVIRKNPKESLLRQLESVTAQNS